MVEAHIINLLRAAGPAQEGGGSRDKYFPHDAVLRADQLTLPLLPGL
jgi:hypothetical protein